MFSNEKGPNRGLFIYDVRLSELNRVTLTFFERLLSIRGNHNLVFVKIDLRVSRNSHPKTTPKILLVLDVIFFDFNQTRLVGLELRAGSDRERALRNLGIRTGVDEVGTWVTMVIQADRFGTSIASALRVHSEMLRTKRRQRAEEAAAKIALKLLFPLIFFIFPSLMLVLLGPSFIQIFRVLLPTLGGGGQ